MQIPLSTKRRRAALVLWSLTVSTLPRLARAQATEETKATAVQLFDEAERHMAEGELAQACPKYAESYRLDPQLGVLIYLGECREKAGQLASAWAAYREATDIGEEREDDRTEAVRAKVKALEPRLNRLTIEVPPEHRRAGLEVLRNGELVSAAAWGTAVPVDAGRHSIEARAPGAEPWNEQLELVGEGVTRSVEVPALQDAPRAPESAVIRARAPEAPGQSMSDSGTAERRDIAPSVYVSGAVTLALAIGTAATGVLYLGKRSDYDEINHAYRDDSGPEYSSDAEKETLRQEAETMGWVATGLGVATVVGAAVTTYLYSANQNTSRSSARGADIGRLRLTPWATHHAGGLFVVGMLR